MPPKTFYQFHLSPPILFCHVCIVVLVKCLPNILFHCSCSPGFTQRFAVALLYYTRTQTHTDGRTPIQFDSMRYHPFVLHICGRINHFCAVDAAAAGDKERQRSVLRSVSLRCEAYIFHWIFLGIVRVVCHL